jgi:peptidyl-prolyl cis-trans isomerase SDCCAG10
MATMGNNQNLSQFFLTLDKTPELTQKSTLFGKIVGDTVFNLLRMGEIELEDETPVYPPKITRIKVVHHPFDDLVPREKPKQTILEKERPVKKAKKNLSLLSFEVDEEDAGPSNYKGKGLFDLIDNQKKSSVPKKEAKDKRETSVKKCVSEVIDANDENK